MHELDDHDLLRQYAEHHSEAAFAALVTRHVDKVYSTALRHTRNAHAAEEITQAVFVILARKAKSLLRPTALSGWLYETARLTTLTYIRSEIRRAHREQEAHMQSTLNGGGDTSSPFTSETAWPHIAPLLDDALAKLSAADRHAIVLRYFDGKSLGAVGAALGASENAAKKRVTRAVEKLRRLFTKRGVTLSATVLTAAISANSVQAAPLGLAATVTGAAAKGNLISATITTLVKTTMKIMTWLKIKFAAGVGVAALLVGGAATLAVSQTTKSDDGLTQSPIEDDSWEISDFKPQPLVAAKVLNKTKPQVRIVDSKYDHFIGRFTRPFNQSRTYVSKTANTSQSIGIGIVASEIILTAYESTASETIFPADMPTGKYDYIANLPQDSLMRLREEIKTKFGLAGKRTMVTTNAFALVLTNPDSPAFKEPRKPSYMDGIKTLREMLENVVTLHTPVVDLTGLTNRYEWNFVLPMVDTSSEEGKQKILQALHDKLGLDLVETNMPIEMLVVEKVK